MEKARLIVPNRQVTSLEEAIKIVNEMAPNYIKQEISDEEIEKAAKESRYKDLDISVGSFELGARWYREQLKLKQLKKD
jgi:hypothetical protein